MVKKPSKKVAYAACNGGCRATADCIYGCVGCGVCVSVCPFEAIEINDLGVAEVNGEKCLGCGKCTRECPRGVLHVHERIFPIVVACSNEAPGKARGSSARSAVSAAACASRPAPPGRPAW